MNEQAAVREAGKYGWAIRKGSPKLEAEILGFYENYINKQGVAAYRLKQYMSRVKHIRNPTEIAEWKRFEQMLVLFQKYGEKYNFDPLMLGSGLPGVAAQPESEESRGRHRGHAGHAGHRQGFKGWRYPHRRAQHPRGNEVHGSTHDKVLPRRELHGKQPYTFRLRKLQRRSGQHLENAKGGRQSRA